MGRTTAEYHRAWYEKNREKRIKQIQASNDRIRRRNQAYVAAFLADHPCVDCGNSDAEVLQFDHVRGVKVADVCQLVWRQVSVTKIQTEIDKCEVRCANCHIKATRRRRRS